MIILHGEVWLYRECHKPAVHEAMQSKVVQGRDRQYSKFAVTNDIKQGGLLCPHYFQYM